MNQNELKPGARLRKFIPQREAHAHRYGNLTLTPRDLDVLEAIWRFRHLESRHIRALLSEASAQNLTRRLAALFHNHFVRRYGRRELMRRATTAGSIPMTYGLDTKGWRALLENDRIGPDVEADEDDLVAAAAAGQEHWRKAYSRRTEDFLEHALGVADFRCTLELALRAGGGASGRLAEWDQTKAIRGAVKLIGAEEWLRVSPDAFFAIEEPSGRRRNFYLEYDRNSEERSRLVDKYTRYWWWLQSDAFRKGHEDAKRVGVLFVTTGGDLRLRNMMGALSEMEKPNDGPNVGGKGWFWFSQARRYQLEEPASILKPIWQRVVRPDEPVSLV